MRQLCALCVDFEKAEENLRSVAIERGIISARELSRFHVNIDWTEVEVKWIS